MANNRKINGGGLRTASDPNVSAPLFNFYAYKTGETYYNNSSQVDFVTYDGNLYVCTDFGGKYASEPTPERNGGFLLIVKKGEDGQQGLTGRPGIDGSTPEIKVRFEGKQLVIYDAATQTRLASSPELVGPTWKPVQKDNKITWKLEEGTPSSIDLDELRPKEERPVLFRLNSDNTKRSDEETGPGYYIQWKREGNEEWTDLMSISELMNIALAGISFWWADDENGATDTNGDPIQRLHVGHKQVVRATYDASKLGNKRIADVELGEVLFDAGEIPFPNYDDEIAALNAFLCDLQGDISIIRNLIPTDYVKSVNGKRPELNGDVPLDEFYYTKPQADAKFLTQHQPIKTLGGQQLIGTGDLGLKTVNGNTLLTVNPNGEDVKVGTVRAITINNVQGVVDQNGAVNMTIPVGDGTSDPIDAYTRDEADERFQPKGDYLTDQDLDGLVRGVRVNNGQPNYPENGIVNITVGDGTQPVDTSDCVKSVTINNNTQRPNSSNNGDLVFTIEVGNLTSFDVKIDDNVLYKNVNGGGWVECGEVEGGTGGGLTTAQVKSLIEQTLAGLLDPLNEYDNGKTGHNYFVRINELNSILSNYYTKGDIDQMIAGGETSILRTFMIFKRSASSESETLPTTAITWNVSEGVLNIPSGSNGWTEHPDNASDSTPYLWVAYGTFESLHGSLVGSWDGPFCLTGADGKDGEDGNGIEFIYHLGASAPSIDYTKSKNYSDNTTATRVKSWWSTEESEDSCPGDNNNGYWTDDPTGISDTNANTKIEWASVRRSHYDAVNKVTVWSDFCNPFIWSMWGEDGVDGAGVEYIFFLTNGENGVVTESNGVYSLNQNNWPDNSWAYEYQAPNSGWTDDPAGVSASVPYEFVSKRTYHMDSQTRQGAWSNWSEPALWSIWKQGDRGPEGNSVTVTDQQRYYKASNLSTGVTAPAITADPTLAANGSWQTSSNSMQLDENNPYLWFFERITYSNGNKWQSTPVVIRYFNSAVNVDYQEIQDNVLEAIGDDLDALDERLSKVVDTNGDVVTDGDNGLVAVITNYTDSNQKSFADIIADAAAAKINANVGAAIWGPNSQKTLTNVKTELDAVSATATTAATSVVNSAISDARTEWSAADASITSTATKAQYVWMADDGSLLEYTADDATNNNTTKSSGGKTYSRTLVSDAMSAIKQTADKVSILVGTNGNVKADVIVDAINGGTVTIDANKINLNGETIARTIEASQVDIKNDQSESTVILSKNGIDVRAGSLGGGNGVSITSSGVTLGSNCTISWDSIDPNTIPAGGSDVDPTLVTEINKWSVTSDTIIANNLKVKKAEVLESLTVNGTPVGSGNNATPLNIVFGISDVPANPDAHTLYFLY